MLSKIFKVFSRELKTARRDSMAILIIVMPVLFAFGITLFTPGLNDTTVNIALLESDDKSHIEYLEQFAKVEIFENREDVLTRVNKRDDMAAIMQKGDGYEIILQGNEPEIVEGYAKALNALYEIGANKEETTAAMYSFGHTVSPLKTMLVNMLISMTIMLSGMLIAISIVGEKADNTINAINVTPVSQTSFVIGKSMMGGLIAMVSIIISLFITGYYDINWFMIILVGLTSLILSLVVGFVQGLASDDVIEAAANVKMIMIPIAGSIVGYELLADKWQWTMYWSPFYWAYKANKLVLTKTADWPTILLCTGMVLVLSLVVYFLAKPKIREGLS
ncbi:MAG: ABC transporter permease [Spirochaetales bacterium]|nr:ABC transporter permease [Spirochaetales bacterium]